ncbi:Axin-1 [Armadillidium nasatum]|uniref:Axin-1 n=1 Tax=Armadillidium nasatum TaxID=96803 RepID=A0A5N5SYC9_9CRUS|nr:Axin-1 [Armadillidium nasatum]
MAQYKLEGDLEGSPQDPSSISSPHKNINVVPSPAEVTDPLDLSSQCISAEVNINIENERLQPLLQRPQNLPLDKENSNVGFVLLSRNEIHLTPSDEFEIGAVKKNEGLRHPPSGEDKSHASRDWNVTYTEMFQDEGGGDGLAVVESDDDAGATPPAIRWAKSLRNLLLDEEGEGAEIFRTFVHQEYGSTDILDFWYACEGLRKGESRFEDINKIPNIIWRRYIRNRTMKVSDQTYNEIQTCIEHNPTNPHIFDQAQLEVEKQIYETLYRAFLMSDLYTSYLCPTKKESSSPTSYDACPPSVSCSSYLPTLHEDSEFSEQQQPAHQQHQRPPRLTVSNLLATSTYRANIEKIKPEANAGYYLKGGSSYTPNPYHITYVSGHAVSLQDSELQSLSSGAHTDDTKSYTDSSVENSSLGFGQPMSRKHQKRQAQKIKENAMQNKEPPIISSVSSGAYVIPRTMLNNESCGPRADSNPVEFGKALAEKLEKYQQEKDSKERLNQSMLKVANSEGAPDEVRREHAVNALPPNVLINKLCEKVQLDDQDPCQSILDEHVARVWDSPIYSPSSPKQLLTETPAVKTAKGGSQVTRQLPHLSYPNPIPPAALATRMSKCALKSSKYSCIPTTASTTSAMYPNIAQSLTGVRGRHSISQGVSGYGGPVISGYQPRNGHHGRRKERGHDVYSTFSSDSGNVADYHDCSERVPPSYLPKSKSMPEYIENHSGAANEVCNRRYCGSGNRRCCRRPPADFTDSGVSVVSDSGRSGAPSSSSDRVESWLFQSRPYTCGVNSSYSVCPGGERDSSKECLKFRSSRSTHTMAGSTSPGTQRKGAGSSGRRSQCSSSTSGNTCINVRADVTGSGQSNHPYEITRDSPLGQAQPFIALEKKKSRGGSNSSKSTGHSSSFEGSGSNGSTMKKQQKSSKQGEMSSQVGNTTITGGGSNTVSTDITTIVYNFQDDQVPFIIKINTRPVTLKKFKQHLHKKGSYRYFFKRFCEDMGMVYEEITDDAEILPYFEGKVFVQIHKDD